MAHLAPLLYYQREKRNSNQLLKRNLSKICYLMNSILKIKGIFDTVIHKNPCIT